MSSLTRGPVRKGGDLLSPCGGRAMDMSPVKLLKPSVNLWP